MKVIIEIIEINKIKYSKKEAHSLHDIIWSLSC